MTTLNQSPASTSGNASNGNLMALLTYLFGFITGIVFIVVEKKDNFIRFHAFQSTILFGGLFVVQMVLGFIPILGMIVSFLLILGGFVLWIVLMIKAYQGERFMLPVIGEMAEKQLAK